MRFLDRILRRTTPPALATRRLEAGSDRRPWGGGPIGQGSGADLLTGLASVRAKSRHATLNNPWLANGTAAWKSALVGSGITPASMVRDATGRATIAAAHAAWAARADSAGQTDYFGLHAAIAAAMVTDGECFVRMIATPDGLRLQVLPAEAVDFALTRELAGGARIVMGIEYDAAGRTVAYWVHPTVGVSPFVSVAPPVRIEAADICHVMRPNFTGQPRGIPWSASVLLSLNELDQLTDALLMGAKIAAMHAGFLTDMNSTGTAPYEGDQTGGVLVGGLEPGTIKILPQGWDIKFSTPQQALAAMDLAKLTLRSVAAGLGVPEYLVSGDLSGANYSSLRAGLVEFRSRVEQVQYHVLIPQLLRPVWNRWLTLEILAGRVDAPGFERDPQSWLACEFYPPRQAWVDPLKDAEAEQVMIAAGLRSRRQAVAAQGYDIETIDAEIAADREREARLGLNFGAPPPAPGAPTS